MLAVGVYLTISMISILKQWVDNRAKSDEAASIRNDRTMQEILSSVTETQRQSISVQERSLEASQEASKAYTEASKMIAEEMRATRAYVDTLTNEIKGVPSRTQVLLDPGFKQILEQIESSRQTLIDILKAVGQHQQ
jgi:hypothetical protein